MWKARILGMPDTVRSMQSNLTVAGPSGTSFRMHSLSFPSASAGTTCYVPFSCNTIGPDNSLYSADVLLCILSVCYQQHSVREGHICMALMQGWAHGDRG